MYADRITESMRRAIDETDRRRGIQLEFNREHGITPQTVKKAIAESWAEADYVDLSTVAEESESYIPLDQIPKQIANLEKQMRDAAAQLEFEQAAELRDRIQRLKQQELVFREA
jgi:excinuclease ABC subunit B